MYTFVSAVLRKKGKNQQFAAVNLTNVKMSELYSTYRDGYIELRNPSLTNNTFVKLTDLKAASNLVYTDALFPTWLAVQGSTTIFGQKTKPTLYSNQVYFSDAFQAGCSIRRVRQSDLNGTNTYPLDMLPDVFLNKTLSDYTILHKYVLTTVNGLLHLNIPAQRGLLVRDAGKSLDIEEDNLIGVLSFETIAEIQQVPIKEEMIQPVEGVESYRKAVYLNLDRDLTGKSVMLSFCGRLFAADEVVTKINSDGAIRIDMYRLDVFDIVQKSIGKIDLSSLELDERLYKAKSLQLSDVIDDDCIKAMLLLSQTFFIIVDTPTMLKETITLNDTAAPGYYEKYQNSKLPFIDSFGVMHPYWKMKHVGAYTTVYRFHLKDTFYRSPIWRTSEYVEPATWLNDNFQIMPRTEYQLGRLLRLFNQVMVYGDV